MKVNGFCSVTFWLNRVAEEETKIGIESIQSAQTRNWQVLQFEKMPKDTQKSVLNDLKNKMKELGWDNSLKNSKEELMLE